MEHEEYKGFTINIIQDNCAENPFESWDCEPPIAVNALYNRGIDEYSTQYGNVNNVPYFDRADVKRAMSTILEITGKSSVYSLVRDVRQHSTDLDAGIHWEVSDAIDSLHDSDRLEALCSLYNALGVPAVVSTVCGYSQGDECEVLAVATQQFKDACGNADGYDWVKCLESAIKLFGYWAFSDVYGYKIEELGDSCFGYYGDYPEYGGAIDEAKAVIDCHIENERKSRIEQIKTWIRNRVPLNHRTLA